MFVDLFMVYQFVRRLATPFNEWPAFKLSIIDDKGNILKPRRTLSTYAEKQAFGVFDVLVLNIKKIIEKLPAGATRIASYAAALYLIKEHNLLTKQNNTLNESVADTDISKISQKFEAWLSQHNDQIQEDIANAVSAGAVAGIGDDQTVVVRRTNQRALANVRRVITRGRNNGSNKTTTTTTTTNK